MKSPFIAPAHSRTRRRAPIAVACLLSTSLVAPAASPLAAPPAAPNPEFKVAITSALSQLKGQLQVTKKALFDDLLACETSIKNGSAFLTEAANVYQACSAFQTAVRTAGNQAMNDIATAAIGILADLNAMTPLNGDYPDDFCWGTGGQLDKARDAVRKEMAKLYVSVDARLKKTRKVALDDGGGALTVFLSPPEIIYDYSIAAGAGSFHSNAFGIDLVIAANRTSMAEDGRAWFAGVASILVATVHVAIGGAEADTVTTVPLNGRWATPANDGGTFFKKGNYLVSVYGDTDTALVEATFSIR